MRWPHTHYVDHVHLGLVEDIVGEVFLKLRLGLISCHSYILAYKKTTVGVLNVLLKILLTMLLCTFYRERLISCRYLAS